MMGAMSDSDAEDEEDHEDAAGYIMGGEAGQKDGSRQTDKQIERTGRRAVRAGANGFAMFSSRLQCPQ